jgi:hypothetical protein
MSPGHAFEPPRRELSLTDLPEWSVCWDWLIHSTFVSESNKQYRGSLSFDASFP